MARVTEGEVRAIVDTTLTINIDPFISIATSIVDRVDTCATEKGITLTASELINIEKLLAAHYYCLRDPLYKSRSTLDASGSFDQGSYLDAAKAADPSGCLQDILDKKRPQIKWAGKKDSSRLTYDQRN